RVEGNRLRGRNDRGRARAGRGRALRQRCPDRGSLVALRAGSPEWPADRRVPGDPHPVQAVRLKESNMQWTELWEHLGWPAIVVASVLAIMGVTSLAVFVERLWALRRSRAASRTFAGGAARTLRPDTIDPVLAEAERLDAGHLARLVHSGLTMYRDAQAGLDGPGLTPVESMRRELQRRVDELVADLKRGLPLLASVGSVAPF